MFYKRYLVFGMDGYYPAGGFDDFLGSFDTLDEANEFWNTDTTTDYFGQAPANSKDWGEIVDLETGQKISLKGKE